MVLQYKLKKETRWRKYPGKDKLKFSVSKYDFRLWNASKTKLLVPRGNYAHVMKRFRAIEFFKRR